MEYTEALFKAWSDLTGVCTEQDYSLRLLNDQYSVDLKNKRIMSASCNVEAKSHYSILILHYLARRVKGLPEVKGQWISFKELPGGQAYYPAFKKRVIDTIVRKYSAWGAADKSEVVDVFEGVPVLITFWRGDEEFAPGANCLFDKSISDIFCTEDVAVLAEILVHSISG
jgi:hypothetical protein